MATGPVVSEHRRSWAGVSVVPAPDPSARFAMSRDAGGWFYLCGAGAGGAVSWDQVTLGGLCHASSGHWEGQAAPQLALIPRGSWFPGTAELQPLPQPLTLPRPDAQVTLALPSLTSLSSAGTQLTAPSSAPRWREIEVGSFYPSPFHPGPSGHLPARPLGPCRSLLNGNSHI